MAAKKPIAKVPKAALAKKVAQAKTVVKKAVGPTARTCPLVMDGEVDAEDFSETDCLKCSEFDCRFCESVHGSGALRSRLFATGGDEGEDDGEDFDEDFDPDGGDEDGDEDEGEEDDLL
jgi:hypothetical protein